MKTRLFLLLAMPAFAQARATTPNAPQPRGITQLSAKADMLLHAPDIPFRAAEDDLYVELIPR